MLSLTVEQQDTINQEILTDTKDWWVPKSSDHTIFETAYMKFLKGNLNYFHLENMIVFAFEPKPLNEAFTKTFKICEDLLPVLDDKDTTRKFGRLNIWKVPPSCEIKPHVDPFAYHFCIDRYLCFLTDGDFTGNVSDKPVDVSKGSILKFAPSVEKHSFKNNDTKDWYFLSIDLWKTNRLLHLAKEFNLEWFDRPNVRTVQSNH